jgi:hypothetical protein
MADQLLMNPTAQSGVSVRKQERQYDQNPLHGQKSTDFPLTPSNHFRASLYKHLKSRSPPGNGSVLRIRWEGKFIPEANFPCADQLTSSLKIGNGTTGCKVIT